jgi:pimeloyl-ACP methyl ester carboxylesterase
VIVRRLALLLLLAACSTEVERQGEADGAPPGFSADTTSWRGLASGATATEAACRALPDGLWVGAGRRRACLRFLLVGTPRPGQPAVVLLSGDPPSAAYSSAGSRMLLQRVQPDRAPSLRGRAAAVEAPPGQVVILLARPGMDGASGDHAQDRHSVREVLFMDDALTQLRARLGFGPLALAGFSSGGTLAANLLARRDDVRCAVLASAPLDLAGFYRRADGTVAEHVATRGDLADPMRSARLLRSAAMVWVIGDARDRKVPATLWRSWAAAARARGVRVIEAAVRSGEEDDAAETHHHDDGATLRLASGCLAGLPEGALRAVLAAGDAP